MKKIALFLTGLFAGLLISCIVVSLAGGLKTIPTLGGGYAQNDLGSQLTVSTSIVTTRKSILASYSGRQYVLIQNGAVASYLSFDPASTSNAVYLEANGQYIIDNSNLYNGNIYASSTAGTTTIIVTQK